MLDVQAHADDSYRYSNTLLVSLNNRIYFRDHPYTGDPGNTQCHVDSGGRSYPSVVSSLTFAHPTLHSHTNSMGDSLRQGALPCVKVINIGESAVIEESIEARCVQPSHDFVQADRSLRILVMHDIDNNRGNRSRRFMAVMKSFMINVLNVTVMCLIADYR